jgi:CheY-like chemotaxis protein
MKILLIEDDEFKASDIAKVLADTLPDATVQRAMSVTSALRAINGEKYSLVILDMSLPTFELTGPGGGGSPQGQGGLEVLRLARRLNNMSPFIILTQYPDIEIDGRDVPLAAASKALRGQFKIDVKMCLLYEFDGDAWREPFRECLSTISNTSDLE